MLIQKYLSVEEFLSSCSLKICYLVVSGEAKRFAQPCLGDSEEFLEIKKKFKCVRLECEYWWARQCQICHAVYEI